MTKYIINKSHKCLRSVTGLIASHCTWSIGCAAYEGRYLGIILSDAPCIYQGTEVGSGKELIFRARDIVLSISGGKWPDTLEFDISPVGTNVPYMEHPWTIRHSQDFAIWQGASAFVTYYDGVQQDIEAKHGNNPINWPELLNFCRVVRNSFAHGNKIYFKSPNSKSVNWNKLTYSYADNGNPVMNKDLVFADLIVLMKESSELLK